MLEGVLSENLNRSVIFLLLVLFSVSQKWGCISFSLHSCPGGKWTIEHPWSECSLKWNPVGVPHSSDLYHEHQLWDTSGVPTHHGWTQLSQKLGITSTGLYWVSANGPQVWNMTGEIEGYMTNDGPLLHSAQALRKSQARESAAR